MPPNNNLTHWQAFKSTYELQESDLHVWRIPLQIDTKTQIAYWRILTKDEKERANNFFSTTDKIGYIAGRGAMRILLGRYLHKSAEQVSIQYAKNGKPYVEDKLEFNLSNSKNMAVFVVNQRHIVGVDIEYTPRMIEFASIAKRFFSEEESTVVLRAKSKDLPAYFYNCWTRKEAFIKALGDGLSFPLDQFVVTCAPEDTPRLISTKWDAKEQKAWNLWAFDIGLEYTGAIASKSLGKELSFFHWTHRI